MIKANELRIGNWVLDIGDQPAQVIKLTKDKIQLASPILLTPEILEKCGFVYDKRNEFYKLNDFIIRYENGLIELLTTEDAGLVTSPGFSTNKYLHQLQNLYFALTGEELTVNFHVATSF